MSLQLTPIDTVDNISRADFVNNYLNPRKPLIIRKATQNWPALQKWTFDYLKETVGDQIVPLYDSSKADPSKAINASASEMKFADYIDLIQKQPTDLRIFLFDPIKHAPKLLDDYRSPSDLMGGFLDKYPNMFLGGRARLRFCIMILTLPIFFIPILTGVKK